MRIPPIGPHQPFFTCGFNVIAPALQHFPRPLISWCSPPQSLSTFPIPCHIPLVPYKDVEILLVEDNPDDLELALRALRKHHVANTIHVVRDGEEALDFVFARGPYAEHPSINLKVILLDLKLPKVSGLEVLKQLKEDRRTQMIPVVALTSSREQEDMLRGYRYGVNSYLQKPIEFEAFEDMMKRLGCYWVKINQPAPKILFVETPAAAQG